MHPARRPFPCGCGAPLRPPRPPVPDPSPCPPYPDARCGGYLMQRVIAYGRLYRRHACYPLELGCLPAQARPPFTVLEAALCGPPQWEEAPCRASSAGTLLITLPLRLRVRDENGCVYMITSEIREELCLRCACAPKDLLWRGQPFAQASVRLAGRACPCDGDCCEVPLEVAVEGYILSPCMMGAPQDACCPPPKPQYPQFHCEW